MLDFFKKILNFVKGISVNSVNSVKNEIPVLGEFKIYAPFDGVVVPQSQIPDDVFSEGHMGKGLGITPSGSGIVKTSSFMKGKLEVLFKTKHAYIIRDDQTQVAALLHIGINTVNIPAERVAFTTSRKEGDVFKSHGEDMCEINVDSINEAIAAGEASSLTSALLVQDENMEKYKVVYHVESGEVEKGALLMSVVPA